MKKKLASTFVLNVSDYAYFFVEGTHGKTKEPLYHVYYEKNEKPFKYAAENFVETHGIDEKKTIVDFTRDAMLNLTVLQESNPEAVRLYNTFSSINSLVLSTDRKNPKLGKMKSVFADAVLEYNEIKELLPKKVEISYEDNYNLVNGNIKQSVKAVNREINLGERRVVKQITNSHEEEKGLQRILKHD